MTTDVTVYEQGGAVGRAINFDEEKLALLRKTLANGLTETEFQLFTQSCSRLRLDPFAKQIYAMKAGGRMVLMIGIDGLRLIASETGEYEGQVGPEWCGEDGIWRDVWLEKAVPAAARVGVYRRNFRDPLWGVASFKTFGKGTDTWKGMPDIMLAKCAEAQALRKAFPQQVGELYTEAESAAIDYVSASTDDRPRIKPPKSKRQTVLEAHGIEGDEEAIEGEVVDAPEPAPERAKTFAERQGPPFGGEVEDPPAPKRAAKPKAAPAETVDAPEGDLNTWPGFYNAISAFMKQMNRDFGDLGMVLNCPGTLIGVKEWFADTEGRIPDRYAHAHRALIGLE